MLLHFADTNVCACSKWGPCKEPEDWTDIIMGIFPTGGCAYITSKFLLVLQLVLAQKFVNCIHYLTPCLVSYVIALICWLALLYPVITYFNF